MLACIHAMYMYCLSNAFLFDSPTTPKCCYFGIQWNPCIADTIGNQHLVLYSEVSLTQGLLVYSVFQVGVVHVLCNRAVEHKSLAVHWQGRLSRDYM